MTTLISDSINMMGDPRPSSSSSKNPSSISLVDSFKDWWSSLPDLLKATGDSETKEAKLKNRLIEYELFKAILSKDVYIKPPNESQKVDKENKVYGELLDVEVDTGVFIHEFYLENNLEPIPKAEEQHIVIIHGYMAALGYFIKNVEAMVKSKPGVRLHIIDLIGFGNSSRPKFPEEFLAEPESKENKINQILSIENWFISSIENWRNIRNLRKFQLIGHSMGAYLSSCYLLKYNNQYKNDCNDSSNIVDKFIIVSPMGTESNYNSLINEKRYQFNHHEVGGDPFKELVTTQGLEHDSDELIKLWERLGKPKFPKNYILKKIWEFNKSPFQILQKLGPFYSKILSYWSFQRFRNLKSNDGSQTTDLILKLHNYSYSIFNQFQGSGELAITKLINHEILAKLPLCDRGFVEFLNRFNLHTLWIYGDKDWMNIKGGYHIFERIDKLNKGLSEFKIIEDAGHHIYLDNPECFNNTCLEFFNLI